MRRGELRLTDFDPSRGSEANKIRPAVIISNDRENAGAVNRGSGLVTVIPVTSNIRRVLAFQTLLPAADTGLRLDSKTQPELIRATAIDYVGRLLGRLPPGMMNELEHALRLHLQL